MSAYDDLAEAIERQSTFCWPLLVSIDIHRWIDEVVDWSTTYNGVTLPETANRDDSRTSRKPGRHES